jgi:hypothetical protein
MPPTPSTNPSPPSELDAAAARRLVQAATAVGQTVLDLDDDHALRHAATSQGRDYVATALVPGDEPDVQHGLKGHQVVVRWPRPEDETWMTHAPQAFAQIRALLVPGGAAAVILEPTPVQAFTITWTGALLSAAAAAGLTNLQDVICLRTVARDDLAPGVDSAAGERHRVVLVLRAPAGRHALD